ncbi:MAG: hypothetical protein ACYDBB_07410 [Armatimonadota bacterium]
MELKPIKGYTTPSFPTRATLDAHPELLRLVPRRWRENALVLSALTTACLLMSGCRTQSAEAQSSNTPSRIAPLFIHGEGRGAFGGKPLSIATIFLPEDEARAIIQDEAKHAGLAFKPDMQTLKDIAMPVTDVNPPATDAKTKPPTRKAALVVDGTDAKKKVNYEYVSQEDFNAWRDPKSQPHSTAQVYDITGAASTLRDGLVQAKPQGAYGVFYAPLGQGKDTAEAKKQAQDELRKQVKDFLTWLKAQGVI